MRTVSKRPTNSFEQPIPTRGRLPMASSTLSMSARSEIIRKPSTPRWTRFSIASVSAATGYSGIRRRVGTTTAVRPVAVSSMRIARTRSEIQVLRIVFTSTATTPRCSVSSLRSASGKFNRSAASRTRWIICGLISSDSRSARSATALEMPSEFATSCSVPRSWSSASSSAAVRSTFSITCPVEPSSVAEDPASEAGSMVSSEEVASLLMDPLNRIRGRDPGQSAR